MCSVTQNHQILLFHSWDWEVWADLVFSVRATLTFFHRSRFLVNSCSSQGSVIWSNIFSLISTTLMALNVSFSSIHLPSCWEDIRQPFWHLFLDIKIHHLHLSLDKTELIYPTSKFFLLWLDPVNHHQQPHNPYPVKNPGVISHAGLNFLNKESFYITSERNHVIMCLTWCWTLVKYVKYIFHSVWKHHTSRFCMPCPGK